MARASGETGIICLTVNCMLSNKCKKIFTFIYYFYIIFIIIFILFIIIIERASLCYSRISDYNIIRAIVAHGGPIKQYIHIDDLRFGRIWCEQF